MKPDPLYKHDDHFKHKLCILTNPEQPDYYQLGDTFMFTNGRWYDLPGSVEAKDMDDQTLTLNGQFGGGRCSCTDIISVYNGDKGYEDYHLMFDVEADSSTTRPLTVLSPEIGIAVGHFGDHLINDWGVRIEYDGIYGDVWAVGKSECEVPHPEGADPDKWFVYTINSNGRDGYDVASITYRVPKIEKTMHYAFCFKPGKNFDMFANTSQTIKYTFNMLNESDEKTGHLSYIPERDIEIGGDADRCYCADPEGYDIMFTDPNTRENHFYLTVDEFVNSDFINFINSGDFEVIFHTKRLGEQVVDVNQKTANWYPSLTKCGTDTSIVDLDSNSGTATDIVYLTYYDQ